MQMTIEGEPVHLAHDHDAYYTDVVSLSKRSTPAGGRDDTEYT
jgi:hypothetical protein